MSVNQEVNQEQFTQRKTIPEPEEVFPTFEINPNETFTVRKDDQKREASRQERSGKIVKKPVPKTADSSEPVGSWFHRQFGGLFSEDDAEIDK